MNGDLTLDPEADELAALRRENAELKSTRWATGLCSAHQQPDPLCRTCNPRIGTLVGDILSLDCDWYETDHGCPLDRECLACRLVAALAEVERLKGLKPELGPFPPEGTGAPRYGLRWNGPRQPLAVPMTDGYWTPWHLAQAEAAEARKDADAWKCQLAQTDERVAEEVEQEREACAQVAETWSLNIGPAIAAAIRARSGKP